MNSSDRQSQTDVIHQRDHCAYGLLAENLLHYQTPPLPYGDHYALPD